MNCSVPKIPKNTDLKSCHGTGGIVYIYMQYFVLYGMMSCNQALEHDIPNEHAYMYTCIHPDCRNRAVACVYM